MLLISVLAARLPGRATRFMSGEFVDTNILIYAHEHLSGLKYLTAVELLDRLFHEATGAMSIQVICEFYSVASRKLQGSEMAEAVIQDLGNWATIHSPKFEDIPRAISLQRRFQIQWWDAMIVNSAIQLGCSVLWTEDLNHGQVYDGVTVRNPFLQGNGRPKTSSA
jgi:predicted nucleic acid-binding protein